MSADIVKLRPSDDPAEVAKWAAEDCADVLVLGYDKDGDFYFVGTKRFEDGGECLWLIEKFKAQLLAGDFEG